MKNEIVKKTTHFYKKISSGKDFKMEISDRLIIVSSRCSSFWRLLSRTSSSLALEYPSKIQFNLENTFKQI
jgi:hypothetical protein